jgi:hypothetical protein
MPPETVDKLYRRAPGEDALTFSQLCRRTEDYFARKDGADQVPPAVRNMELKGQFLGCRARGEAHDAVEPQREAPPSEFLAHHATPRESTPPLLHNHLVARDKSAQRERARASDEATRAALRQAGHRLATVDEEALLWKGRWLDKTVDDKKTRTTFAPVHGISDKMREGNGNVILWDEARAALGPTPRKSREMLDIARRMRDGNGDILSWPEPEPQSGRGTHRDVLIQRLLQDTARETARETARDVSARQLDAALQRLGASASAPNLRPAP